MIWFLLFLILLIALLLWLPLQVEIVTGKDIYEARWSGLFRFRAAPDEERWRWFIRFLFWEKELKPGEGEQPEKRVKAAGRKPVISGRQGMRLVKNLLKAIKIRRLQINWDSGDFMLNAWLYPLFRLLNRRNIRLQVNFMGNQEIAIFLQTRLYRLGWAFLRTFFNTKK